MVADPKAIHHILQGTTYLYEKPAITGEFLSLVMDWGLVSVEGELFGYLTSFDPYFELRERTQTSEEGHDTRLWSRRSKSAVSLFHPMCRFGQLSFHRRVVIDPRSKRLVTQQVVDKWHEILSNTEQEQVAVIDVHCWFEKAMLDAYV